MMNLRASGLFTIGVALALVLGSASLAAAANNAPAAAPGKAPAVAAPAPAPVSPAEEAAIESAVNSMPPDVVTAAIANGPGDMDRVRRYLTGGTPDMHGILIRSLAVVRSVSATPTGQDPQQLLAVASRVGQAAREIVENHSVVRVTVDRDYRRTANAVAYKFGPAGAAAPAGFELVTPGDHRLEGMDIATFDAPGTAPLVTSGLRGVHCFSSALNNGKYRVILLTEELAADQTGPQPFGSDIIVNGHVTKVVDSDPSQWLKMGYLTNRQVAPPPSAALQTSMAGSHPGVVTHEAPKAPAAAPATPISPIPPGSVASTAVGAFVTKADVTNKSMNICFEPGQNTVLIGAIFEAPSGTQLSATPTNLIVRSNTAGATQLARLESGPTFPTADAAPHGKPWRIMHRDGWTGTTAQSCRALGLTKSQCETYQKMAAAGECKVELMPNGVVLSAMGYTSANTHQIYTERNVLVDLKNPISREVELCHLGPGLYVGRAFGCNNPIKIEAADTGPDGPAPAGSNLKYQLSSLDIEGRVLNEALGLTPPAAGPPDSTPGGPGITIPPHVLTVSPT